MSEIRRRGRIMSEKHTFEITGKRPLGTPIPVRGAMGFW